MPRIPEGSAVQIEEKTAQQRATEFLNAHGDPLVRQRWNQARVTWRANRESGTEEPIIHTLREFARLTEQKRVFVEQVGDILTPEAQRIQTDINAAIGELAQQLGMQKPAGGKESEAFNKGFSALAEDTFSDEREVPPVQQTQETPASVSDIAPDRAVDPATAAPVVEELAEPWPDADVARDDVATIPTPHAASPAEPAIEPTAFPEPDASSADAPAPDPVAEPSAEPVIVPAETLVVESADSEQADEQIEPVGGADEASSSGSGLAPTQPRAAVPLIPDGEVGSGEPTLLRTPATEGAEESSQPASEQPFRGSMELNDENLNRAWQIISRIDPSSPMREEDMAQLLHILQGDFRRQLFAPENISLIPPGVREAERSIQSMDGRELRERQIDVLMDIAHRGSEDDFIFMLRLVDPRLRRAIFKNICTEMSIASRGIWAAQLNDDNSLLVMERDEYALLLPLSARINRLMPPADRRAGNFSDVASIEAAGYQFANLIGDLPKDTPLPIKAVIDIVEEEVKQSLYQDIDYATEDVRILLESGMDLPANVIPFLRAIQRGVQLELYEDRYEVDHDIALLEETHPFSSQKIFLFSHLRSEEMSPSEVGLTPDVLAAYYTVNERERPKPTVSALGIAFENHAAKIVDEHTTHELLTDMRNRLLSVSPENRDRDMETFVETWVDELGTAHEENGRAIRRPLNSTQQMQLRGMMYSFIAELERPDRRFIRGVDGEGNISQRILHTNTLDDLDKQLRYIGITNEGGRRREDIRAFDQNLIHLFGALRLYAGSQGDAMREGSIPQLREQFIRDVEKFVESGGKANLKAAAKAHLPHWVSSDPLQGLYALPRNERQQAAAQLKLFVDYDDYDYLIDAYMFGAQQMMIREAFAEQQRLQPASQRVGETGGNRASYSNLQSRQGGVRIPAGSNGRQPQPRPGQSGQPGRGFGSSRWGDLDEPVLNTNAATGTNGGRLAPRPAAFGRGPQAYRQLDAAFAGGNGRPPSQPQSFQGTQSGQRDVGSHAGGVRPGSSGRQSQPRSVQPGRVSQSRNPFLDNVQETTPAATGTNGGRPVDPDAWLRDVSSLPVDESH